MGTITLNKYNRLFWLGRYAERVYQNSYAIIGIHDRAIDDENIDVNELCIKYGLPCKYSSVDEFCSSFCFDRSLPNSILATADAMLGNGMVLREMLGSPTLSYLQMSVSALEMASNSHAYSIQLQWVLDDIMAFRGSYAENVDSEMVRNTIKSGASIERVSTILRFYEDKSSLKREVHKLLNRLYKTQLEYDAEKLDRIKEFAFTEGEGTIGETLLNDVETLFVI